MFKEDIEAKLRLFNEEFGRTQKLEREKQRYETVGEAANRTVAVGLQALLAVAETWRCNEANPSVAASESLYTAGLGSGPLSVKNRNMSMMYAVRALMDQYQANRE
jgi:hypothetical protein